MSEGTECLQCLGAKQVLCSAMTVDGFKNDLMPCPTCQNHLFESVPYEQNKIDAIMAAIKALHRCNVFYLLRDFKALYCISCARNLESKKNNDCNQC
jgi:hypothetical protein